MLSHPLFKANFRVWPCFFCTTPLLTILGQCQERVFYMSERLLKHAGHIPKKVTRPGAVEQPGSETQHGVRW